MDSAASSNGKLDRLLKLIYGGFMFTDIINALNDPNGQILLALNFALIMQLLGALLAVAIDPYMKRDNRRRIFFIVMIIFALLIEPQVSNTYGDTLYRNHLAFWNTMLSSVSYILRSVALYLFIKLTGSTRWDKVLNYIILINAISSVKVLMSRIAS